MIAANIRHLLPPIKGGKQPTKWKISLGTGIRRDAAVKARKLASEHDAFITAGRQPNPLTALSDTEQTAIDLAGGLHGYLDWLNQRAGDAARLGDEAASWREFAVEEKLPGEVPDPDWLSGQTAALDAERLQINRQLARDVPLLRRLGQTPGKLSSDRLTYLAEAVAANPRDPSKITLSGVVDAWKEQTSPTAPEQYEYPVKLFEELHGALPIKQITVDHVRAFRDAVLKMAPASGGKYDGMTMQQVIRLADAKNLPRLRYSTASKHFRCLRAIFAFAADDGYVDVNVAAGVKIRPPKRKYVEAEKIKRRTFSPSEMSALFQSAEETPWRDKIENLWFLRLMTWTGARPEELAQLSPDDVQAVAGHLCLDLHDAGDNHIKNPSSVRKIPLHPVLLRLGFSEFVSAAYGRTYLFSSLEADSRGRLYGRMQDWLTRLIDRKVSGDSRLVPYSLRHGFKDAMRLAGAPEEVVEQIMGHSNPEHRPDADTVMHRLL